MTRKVYDAQRYKIKKPLLKQQCANWRQTHKMIWTSYAIAKRREYLVLMEKVKNRPCVDCGGWFKPWQMDFDHRDNRTKVRDVSKLATSSRIKLWKEIAKCDLVCANCHRDRTYRRTHAI